ncbi:helix-turn-helix domain-containing protein [Sulfurisphaera tokodaii]|uniref:Helix-turn-helix domain-containing protein n=2 Tax=Sulfurisphaera tokodaii TaxID=111955 RepID=Q96Z87_SULTO|nr:helix-turn-helix domain-containing protein [Sulfurisphaera tokodaii]BAB67039.1 hypothetical protein STK_19440 [Sulfurisphaera tokodaii str. 7]HII74478.1 helix-turn-helix domain-containing protein [Sulfurisphaera tokodaii]
MVSSLSSRDKELLTPKEACDMLNISYRTLLRWINEGKIKAVKLNSGRIRIPLEEIEKVMEEEDNDKDITAMIINEFMNSSEQRKKDYKKYTELAKEFARKLLNNTIIHISVLPSTYEKCGIACSEGISILGNIYVSEGFFSLPESVKEFIIAHEVAHIIRGHSITKYVLSIFTGVLHEEARQLTMSSFRDSRIIKKIARFFIGAILEASVLYADATANAQTIKQQELEADSYAAKLVGTEKTKDFIKFLELYRQDYNNISHTSLLGFPALTIDERISNLEKLIKGGLDCANLC